MSAAIVSFNNSEQKPQNVASRFGPIPVTGTANLGQEVIEHVSFIEAVELVDACFAKWPAEVAHLKREWSSSHGVADRMMRDVLAACAEGVESPMETRTRLLLIMAGFGEPAIQWEVLLDGCLRRFDLAYPELKIAIEYDGAHHFMTEERKHDDAIRRDASRSVFDGLVKM